MMKNILVAGVAGFVGQHLARELVKQGCAVHGTGIEANLPDHIKPLVKTYYGSRDLTKPANVSTLPLPKLDAVINLAGLANLGASFKEGQKYLDINVKVHTVLLDALVERNIKNVRVVSISTGAVYDSVQAMPISETGTLITKGSPYALSKIAMENEVAAYRKKGLDVVIARPFNHIGPGQLPGFILPDLANQVFNGDEIVVGDLSTKRDYTDVRDVVRAYVSLATAPELDKKLFNVCSGHSISGQELLDLVFELSGTPKKPVRVDESRLRPDDPKDIYGDNTLLKQSIGWQPEIPLRQTIADYLATL